MIVYTTEARNFVLNPGVNCHIAIPVPDLGANSEQAPALGKSHSEKSETLDKFLSEIFFPQYIAALRRAISHYLAADLPEKFLHGMNVTVRSMPIHIDGIYGTYCEATDTVTVDADTLSSMRNGIPGEFLYGHEVGHRIVFKKNRKDAESAISDVCSILAISDRDLALECLCDAFGELLSTGEGTVRNEFYGKKVQGLKRAALRLAWSC